MNREDIIAMAQEAGFLPQANPVMPQLLERFAALVASAEREACAKVCEDSVEYAGDTLAEAIRARGNVATNDTSQERVDETTKQRHDTPPQPVIDKSAAVRIATALGWTPQRTWVGLTDEEVSEIIDAEIGFNSCWGPEETFARAIEAKLKEKNI